MKHLVFLFVLVTTSIAFAEDKSDGCGLGWQVTKKMSMVATTTRSTTNSIIPNTFGMTSGTLGCARHSVVLKDKAPQHFVEANYETLLVEMSMGQGEALQAFSQVLGCDSKALGQMVQENYSAIVPRAGVTPSEILAPVRAWSRTHCLGV